MFMEYEWDISGIYIYNYNYYYPLVICYIAIVEMAQSKSLIYPAK